jgi:coenzyme F420-0:L-glutamate ligase / coenzyme F420-1:gamma-L-glutamate ligase
MDHPLFSKAAYEFVARMRVARLATAGADGRPYVVPIVFALDGERLYTPVDQKPKQVAPNQLRRVRNIMANPQVSVVVDHYDDQDWTRLAWVLMTGRAEVQDDGDLHTRGRTLLEEKYGQYQTMRLDDQPLIIVRLDGVRPWGSIFTGPSPQTR